jgi:hypothetical protein
LIIKILMSEDRGMMKMMKMRRGWGMVKMGRGVRREWSTGIGRCRQLM